MLESLRSPHYVNVGIVNNNVIITKFLKLNKQQSLSFVLRKSTQAINNLLGTKLNHFHWRPFPLFTYNWAWLSAYTGSLNFEKIQ